MDITARTIEKGDLEDWLCCLRTGFLIDRAVGDEHAAFAARHYDLSRTFAAFSGDQLCGTARSFAVDLTLPGGATLAAAAVTQVSVLPTHRRRGALTAMMRAQLQDVAERGEPLAILIASEWPIYGRFGYGQATEWAAIDVDTRRARVRGERAGSIELLTREEFRAIAPEVYDRFRARTVGAISRSPQWWDVFCEMELPPGATPKGERVRVLWRGGDGSAGGYAVYDPQAKWEDGVSQGSIELLDIAAPATAAYRELWRYLCEVDLAVRVHAWPRPLDDLLPHVLADARTARQHERSDHLWIRIIDVPRALAARTYSADGTLVIDVSDDLLGAGGRFELRVEAGRATVIQTDAAPSLSMGIGALGAALLGGTPFALLADGGEVDERTPGAVAQAGAMFNVRPLPFLTTNF